MIFGECPYCDEPFTTGVPDDIRLPAYEKNMCEKCGDWFWTKLSRIDPQSYDINHFTVDEKTNELRLSKLTNQEGEK